MYASFVEAPTPGGAALGATLTAATETAALVSQEAATGALPPSPQGVVLRGRINVTSGATGGGYTLKCRAGTGTGGTQVGATQTITLAATTTDDIPYSFVDAARLNAAGVYTITVTAVGSNGTFNDGSVECYVPEPAGSDT